MERTKKMYTAEQLDLVHGLGEVVHEYGLRIVGEEKSAFKRKQYYRRRAYVEEALRQLIELYGVE